MLIQYKGKIPVTIYPLFWVCAALVGYFSSPNLLVILIWMILIFISVLFHEMGHALAALACGRKPRIELVASGGITYYEGTDKLPFWKQFFIVLSGPVFGALLILIATLLLQVPGLNDVMSGLLNIVVMINLFWTLLNLLPIFPLDGGQLLRLILEAFCGPKGFRYALVISIFTSLIFSLFCFALRDFLLGALFSLWSFQSYDSLRKMRHLSVEDEHHSLKEKIRQIEEHLQKGDRATVETLCHEVRSIAHRGIIFETATQYLAFMEYDKGNLQEVYALLLPLCKDLAGETLCLLQKAAFAVKDFALVVKTASSCFQTLPTPETALISSYAHAQLKQVTASVGWLRTAIEEGLANTPHVFANPLFDPIRANSQFQELKNKISAF